MHKQGDEVHVNETEASGGTKTGHMRWVLGIGLVLAIGLLSIIWISGALTQNSEESTIAESAGVSEEVGDNTEPDDSIVSDSVPKTEAPAAVVPVTE